MVGRAFMVARGVVCGRVPARFELDEQGRGRRKRPNPTSSSTPAPTDADGLVLRLMPLGRPGSQIVFLTIFHKPYPGTFPCLTNTSSSRYHLLRVSK